VRTGVLIVAGALMGCGPPPLDGRAVWAHRKADGTRAVTIYDHGSFSETVLDAEPARGEQYPRVTLGPRGRYMLERLGGARAQEGRIHDLDRGRVAPVRLPSLRLGVDDPVHFTPRGDALYWIDRECTWIRCTPWSLWVAPTPDASELPEVQVLETLTVPGIEASARVAPAAAAPVLYVVASGTLEAIRWRPPAEVPTDSGRPPGAREDRIARVARIETEHPVRVEVAADCPFADWCGVSAASSADGRAFFAISEQCPLGLLRWMPEEAEPVCQVVPSNVEGTVLAAFDARRVVVVSSTLLRVVDVETGYTRSAPVLGDGPFTWRVVDDGDAVVFASASGPLLRATADEVVRVSTDTTQCLEPRGFVASPRGTWMAWACGHVPELAESTGQQVAALVRVSSGGLERFPGTAADPIAVDDDGDLLVTTVEGTRDRLPQLTPLIPSTPGLGLRRPVATGTVEALPPDPLTLYALDATGTLRRIHDLEPTPRPLATRWAGQSRFIQGATR
jgi:hypothetical protein